jgi:hypothetical protein
MPRHRRRLRRLPHKDRPRQADPELAFAGGNGFVVPGGAVTSANLTPDIETGLGPWTKEHFVARFKSAEAHPVAPGGAQSVMPWTDDADMSEQDLRAFCDFLRSLQPIRNPVQKWTPTPAPRAGLGDSESRRHPQSRLLR